MTEAETQNPSDVGRVLRTPAVLRRFGEDLEHLGAAGAAGSGRCRPRAAAFGVHGYLLHIGHGALLLALDAVALHDAAPVCLCHTCKGLN